MKAMRYHGYGLPLQSDEVAIPQTAAGEILVRVATVAVNPYDVKVHAGAYQGAIPVTFPVTPGLEASGTVEALGPDVASLSVGDRVYAKVRAGFAQFAVAKESETARKPDRLTFNEAAALPVALDTAWSVLFDLGGLQGGQRVLIIGAAGSVGSIALQLARWKGASVIAGASADDAEFVKSLGAEVVVDPRVTPIASVARDVDLVFDTVGGPAQDALFATLRRDGSLLSIVQPPSQALAEQYGVRALARFSSTDPRTIPNTQKLVASGAVRATVRRAYPLDEVNEAEAAVGGHGRGKVVLEVATP